jgi:hypothetical protein
MSGIVRVRIGDDVVSATTSRARLEGVDELAALGWASRPHEVPNLMNLSGEAQKWITRDEGLTSYAVGGTFRACP